MKQKHLLSDLTKKFEQLKEDDLGKLRGGFSVVSGSLSDELKEDGTNNCNCKNKNRGSSCAGCSSE